MSEEKNQTEEVTGNKNEMIRKALQMVILVESIKSASIELIKEAANQFDSADDPQCMEKVELFMRERFKVLYQKTNEQEEKLNTETLELFKKKIMEVIGQAIAEVKAKKAEQTKSENERRNAQIEINSDPKSREELEAIYAQVWDLDQLRDEFEVVQFMAPYVYLNRKSNGERVVVAFQHHPRFYFTTERKDETQQSTERAPSPSVRDPEEGPTH